MKASWYAFRGTPGVKNKQFKQSVPQGGRVAAEKTRPKNGRVFVTTHMTI
jgi:hypothetical protein